MMAQAGSSSSASGAGYASSVRAARLREVAVRALDETLTGCTPDDFVEGFPTLSATHGDALRHVCAEAQGQLRENATVRKELAQLTAPALFQFSPAVSSQAASARASSRQDFLNTSSHSRARACCCCLPSVRQAEFDTIFDEMGVSQGLERLDSLIARQPALPDGSRMCVPMTFACLFFASHFLAQCQPLDNRLSSSPLASRVCMCVCVRARSPLTSETEASDLIAMATLATKRQHRAALEAALREVQQENASLQEQYIAAQPALQAASAEIAACKALVEKTATSCERWRAANV